MIKIYDNKTYRGKWVAIKDFDTKPEVVAYGKTLEETLKQAEKRGYKHPTVTQIPKEILPIVGKF